jgi:tetratricopeptide (TPR) repeat protein
MRVIFAVLVACLLFSCQAGLSQLTTSSKRAANHYYLARELYNARKDHEAVERLLQAISIDRTFIEAYLLLGEVYDELEFYNQAIAALESAHLHQSGFFSPTPFTILVTFTSRQGIMKMHW